jgi:hypothetical protein
MYNVPHMYRIVQSYLHPTCIPTSLFTGLLIYSLGEKKWFRYLAVPGHQVHCIIVLPSFKSEGRSV